MRTRPRPLVAFARVPLLYCPHFTFDTYAKWSLLPERVNENLSFFIVTIRGHNRRAVSLKTKSIPEKDTSSPRTPGLFDRIVLLHFIAFHYRLAIDETKYVPRYFFFFSKQVVRYQRRALHTRTQRPRTRHYYNRSRNIKLRANDRE